MKIRLWVIVGLLITFLAIHGAQPIDQPDKPENQYQPSYHPAASWRKSDIPIRLKTASFEPLNETQMTGVRSWRPDLHISSYPTGKDGSYILQFQGPVKEEWKEEIRDLGAEIHSYIPNNAFIVKMNSSTKSAVDELDFVRWIGIYQPAYKISPGLSSIPQDKEVIMTILVFEGEPVGGAVSNITALGGTVIKQSGNILRVSVAASKAQEIALINGVEWVEEYAEPVLLNDVATGIMEAPAVWNYGINGTGRIIAVADTGLDTGNVSTLHLDLRGRVVSLYALGRPPDNSTDPHGHGTHVAGSVLGNGTVNSSIKGTAFGAQLVFQSVLDAGGGLGGIPADLNVLFNQTYADGARVHSNSWGSDAFGDYTTDSRNADMFAWNNTDMVILFAAGNNGTLGSNTICTPGTAKNVITIGASENYRPPKGAYADDPNDMAGFSSRGPTDDGRIKPDVVAPGTYILSTLSSLAGTNPCGWGTYDGNYTYCGGTSMATPLVAGAAALVQEWYSNNQSHNASAALVKAMLIHGAVNISGPIPNNNEGWGRVNLTNSLFPSAPRIMKYDDNSSNALSTNQTRLFNYTVNDTSVPFKATLVWTDYPATAGAGVKLVNDLDLNVIVPNGTVYWGNDNSSGDRINNVEGVLINPLETGTYTVNVTAYNTPQGPQAFALVVSGAFGCFGLPNDVITMIPYNGSIVIPPDASNDSAGEIYSDDLDENATSVFQVMMNSTNDSIQIFVNHTSIGFEYYSMDIDDDSLTGNDSFGLGGVELLILTNGSSSNLTVSCWNGSSWNALSQEVTLECCNANVTYNNTGAQGEIVLDYYYPQNVFAYKETVLSGAYLMVADNTTPAIQFVPPTPNDGANVSGVQVINVTASDINLGIIQILINGSAVLNCSSSPCSYSWNTTLWSDGSYLINATANDTFGNLNTTATVNVTVDNTPPTVQFVSPTPSNGTYNSTQTINVTANDPHLDTIQIAVNNTAVINCSSSPCNYTLTGDGNYLFNATANDTLGFNASTETRNITIDTTPPSSLSIVINSNDTYTNTTSVILTLSAVNATYCRFSNNGTSYTAWEPYTFSRQWNLTSGDGVKTVFYECRDDVWNTASPVNDSIILDTVPPSSLSITINNNASYTNSTSVTLNLSAVNASECRFSNDGGNYSGWEVYSTGKNWVLLPGDGSKTVFYQCKDNASNTASPVSDSITLDTTPPSGLSVLINAGANITNNATVNLTLTYSDNYGIDKCGYSNNGTAFDWYDNTTTKDWNLSSGDGMKIVYYVCNDSAGNMGATVLDGIMLDENAPSITISSPKNKTYASTTVRLEFTPFDVISPTVNCSYNMSSNTSSNFTDLGILNCGELSSTNLSGLQNATQYWINVSCSDQIGNENTSSTIYFTIDTSVMDVVLLLPQNITYNYNTSLPLNYTTSKPANWTAYNVNGTNITITPPGSNTTFNTSEGSHILIIYANDSSGQMASDSVSFTVDMTPPNPPTVSLTPPYTSPVNITGVWVNGTSEGYAGVEVFVNGTSMANTTAFGDGSYGAPVSLTEGDNNITARATDLAGNTGNNSTGLIVILDIAPPSAPNLTQPTSPVSSSPINLTGSTEGNATVYIYISGGLVSSANANASGNFTASVPITEGNNSITARAMDTAGNLGNASSPVYVFLDTIPPAITNLAPADGGLINDIAPNITARFEDDSGIDNLSIQMVFNGSNVTPTYNAATKTVNYTPATNLTGGIYIVSVSVNDTLNNSASRGWSFSVDTIPPNPPTNLDATNTTSGINVSWTASTSADVASYNVYRSSSAITNTSGLTPIATGITGTFYFNNLSVNATYWYAATAVDLAGNEGNVSNSDSATFNTGGGNGNGDDEDNGGYRRSSSKLTNTWEIVDVDVGEGVTVPFSVKRVLFSSETLSEVTIEIRNRGSISVYNVTYKEGIPSSIATEESSLTFSIQPDRFESGSIVAVWEFDEIEPMEVVTLKYSVKKLVDDMLGVWFELSATKEVPPPPVQTATISGPPEAFVNDTITLTVLVNGTAKEGLVVEVTTPSGKKETYTTDDEGAVAFKAEHAGTYSYSVSGYSTSGVTATLVKEAYALPALEKAIIAGDEGVVVGESITLMVTLENGTPLVNVTVSVTTPNGGGFALVTDENGAVTFKAEHVGTYSYSISGYPTEGVTSTTVTKKSIVLPWEEGGEEAGQPIWILILILLGVAISLIGGALLVVFIVVVYYIIRKIKRGKKGL